jgi:hypothetical protein
MIKMELRNSSDLTNLYNNVIQILTKNDVMLEKLKKMHQNDNKKLNQLIEINDKQNISKLNNTINNTIQYNNDLIENIKQKKIETNLLIKELKNKYWQILYFDDLFSRFPKEFIDYFLIYNICRSQTLFKSESSSAYSISTFSTNVNGIINAIIEDFMIKIKKTSTEHKNLTENAILDFKKEMSKFKIQNNHPELFIRFFDPKNEKINDDNKYIVDFSKPGMRDCNDYEYQDNTYEGCKVVGFFNFLEMDPQFYALFKKFTKFCSPLRKIVVWNRDKYPEDSNIIEFRPVISQEEYLKQRGENVPDYMKSRKNSGEYVLRMINNEDTTYSIPVEIYDNLNSFLLKYFIEDIFQYIGNISIMKNNEKNSFYNELMKLEKQYTIIPGENRKRKLENQSVKETLHKKSKIS